MLFNEQMVNTPFNLQLLKTTFVILHFIVQHLLRLSLQELYSFHTHPIIASPCLLQWWMSAQNNLCQVLRLQKGCFIALAYGPQFMRFKIQNVTHFVLSEIKYSLSFDILLNPHTLAYHSCMLVFWSQVHRVSPTFLISHAIMHTNHLCTHV